MSWVVKRKHYAGGESIVAHKATKEEAQKRADEYNLQYQTDNYIVEEYSATKANMGWDLSEATKSAVAKIRQSLKDSDKTS